MKPAVLPQRLFAETRMMVVDGKSVQHSHVGDLLHYLKSDDLLVVNRSGTLPSSFRGVIERQSKLHGDIVIEIRLAAFRGDSPTDLRRWTAVSFGEGDWRVPTEKRGAPPRLEIGDRVRFGEDLSARITGVCPWSERMFWLEFESNNLVQRLYEYGRPIQYSYLRDELAVWDQQTIFSGAAISVEPPCAAFPLTWEMVLALRARGVGIAPILHGAGLSSTGDAELDKRFPLNEYFEVPTSTLKQIANTHARGGRVIAVGTSVARALESAARMDLICCEDDSLRGYTSLVIGADTRLRFVDGLITGMHEEGTSHAELMKAFASLDNLKRAEEEASALEYRSHEFGDITMLIRSA